MLGRDGFVFLILAADLAFVLLLAFLSGLALAFARTRLFVLADLETALFLLFTLTVFLASLNDSLLPCELIRDMSEDIIAWLFWAPSTGSKLSLLIWWGDAWLCSVEPGLFCISEEFCAGIWPDCRIVSFTRKTSPRIAVI